MPGKKNNILSKFLFVFLIILFAITVILTLLGGAGTICAAFNPEDYEAMKSLVPYKTIYKIFFTGSLAIGIWGAFVVVNLIRRRPGIYRSSLIVLILGALLSGLQTVLSEVVRGTSVPGNFRFYVNAVTLIIFLLFLIPGLKNLVNFEKETDSKSSGRRVSGITLFVCGIIMISMKLWTGTSHISFSGDNWIDIASLPIQISSVIMILSGARLLLISSEDNFVHILKERIISILFLKKVSLRDKW